MSKLIVFPSDCRNSFLVSSLFEEKRRLCISVWVWGQLKQMICSGSSGWVRGYASETRLYQKNIRPVSEHEVGSVCCWWRLSYVCWTLECVFSTVYGLHWFIRAFGLCGWIAVCVPTAAFQLKWAGGENFPGFFFANSALSMFGSHGNEVFGNVSVLTFKFINRHVHPPVVLLIRVSDTESWVFVL